MATATANGSLGWLRVGCRDAAVLGPWRLHLEPRLPRRFTLSALLTWRGARFGDRPMTLALALADDLVWEWRHVDPIATGDTVVVAGLGRPDAIVRFATTEETEHGEQVVHER